MIKFREILLPTDFSELAVHAARFARSLAELCGARLHVLHAYQPHMPIAPSPIPDAGTSIIDTAVDPAAAQDALNRFVESEIKDDHPNFVVVLRTGTPVRVISEYVKEAGINLVVIGTHARGVVNRIFMGSVSKAVMESAGCAVLMIPWDATAEEIAEPNATEVLRTARSNGAL